MDTGFQLLAASINAGQALADDGQGFNGRQIRGTGRQMFAVLAEAREDGLGFEAAWKKARRSLLPPRTGDRNLAAGISIDLRLEAEIKAFWRAAYEGLVAEDLDDLAEGRQLAEERLAILFGD